MKVNAAALAVPAIICAIIACTPSRPIKQVDLEERSNNEFLLEHRIVKSSDLKAALQALANPKFRICVNITGRTVTYEEQLALMQRIREAGISCVGITGVDEFS